MSNWAASHVLGAFLISCAAIIAAIALVSWREIPGRNVFLRAQHRHHRRDRAALPVKCSGRVYLRAGSPEGLWVSGPI